MKYIEWITIRLNDVMKYLDNDMKEGNKIANHIIDISGIDVFKNSKKKKICRGKVFA